MHVTFLREVWKNTKGSDSRKCQTSTATPAKPGVLPIENSSHSGILLSQPSHRFLPLLHLQVAPVDSQTHGIV